MQFGRILWAIATVLTKLASENGSYATTCVQDAGAGPCTISGAADLSRRRTASLAVSPWHMHRATGRRPHDLCPVYERLRPQAARFAGRSFREAFCRACFVKHTFGTVCDKSPLSSSFLGLPCRILNINHKKELLRGLWVWTMSGFCGSRPRNKRPCPSSQLLESLTRKGLALKP